jgi:hypothetical protein
MHNGCFLVWMWQKKCDGTARGLTCWLAMTTFSEHFSSLHIWREAWFGKVVFLIVPVILAWRVIYATWSAMRSTRPRDHGPWHHHHHGKSLIDPHNNYGIIQHMPIGWTSHAIFSVTLASEKDYLTETNRAIKTRMPIQWSLSHNLFIFKLENINHQTYYIAQVCLALHSASPV